MAAKLTTFDAQILASLYENKSIPLGNVVEAGDIDGLVVCEQSLLIQFATESDVREAIKAGRCSFTLFQHYDVDTV